MLLLCNPVIKPHIMKQLFTWLSLLLVGQAIAQTNISGKVTSTASSAPLIGVSIQVKGKIIGTTTDHQGRFALQVNDQPPLVLVISSIGFAPREVTVDQPEATLSIALKEQSVIAGEVVVSASRIEENVLESPVSIEKLNVLGIRESPQPSFYDALQNLNCFRTLWS